MSRVVEQVDDLNLLWELSRHCDPGGFYMGAPATPVEYQQRTWVCIGACYAPGIPDLTPPEYCPGPSEILLAEVVTREEYEHDGQWQYEDIADPITKANAWSRNHRSWHVGEYVATGKSLVMHWSGT